MSHILLSGNRGFIGSHVESELQKQGHKVFGLDVKTSWTANILLQLIEYDFEHYNIDYVIHLAALKSVGESMLNPMEYNHNNINGTVNLLQLAKKYNVKKLIFASSAAVYGDSYPNTKPLSPYGLTKLVGEQYCEMLKVPYVALRYFNVFGEGTNEGVIPHFIKCALKNEPLKINGDGKNIRDFVYVGDIVKANISACFNLKVVNKIYDVGSSAVSIKNLAKLIIKLTNSKSKIEYLPPVEGDIVTSVANNLPISKDLNFYPSVSLKEGLIKTINWIKNG
jgi:UDP-glucose 4-epimerase